MTMKQNPFEDHGEAFTTPVILSSRSSVPMQNWLLSHANDRCDICQHFQRLHVHIPDTVWGIRCTSCQKVCE